MEEESIQEVDTNLEPQLILLAASHHDIESLRTLLRTGSASVQDPETGFTPLHAAIAACDSISQCSPVDQSGTSDHASADQVNGHCNGITTIDATKSDIEADVEAAAKIIRLLLQNGAIWNDVDKQNETPGCLALRLGLRQLYDIMVDAGVRAEMLLNRLDEYEQLQDSDDHDEDSGAKPTDAPADSYTETGPNEETPIGTNLEQDLHNENFLQSSLHFQNGRILDDSNNGVMMAWETDIMKRTADLLIPNRDLRILNIGHGMGIIDTFIQEKSPSAHHIIEAHPSIIERMRKDGWDTKPNVTIHEGRWQDVVPKLIEQGVMFDAIYYDTFAEDYKALRNLFSDYLIGLLDDGGKWGFFNGLGADRQICYDVYAKVVEMDLFEAGFDTNFETITIPEMGDEQWEGVKRRYWALKEYKLPICEFIG
ncbi:Arginine N-methyltransferase 2 [Lecanora helva]